VATAATVRVRHGETLTTAGPFAETTEQLGGFYILDLPDLDQAIAVASSLPPAQKGTVEIRPLEDLEGLPPSRSIPPAPHAKSDRVPYILLCHDDEAAWDLAGPHAMASAKAEAIALARELSQSGRFLTAAPLRSSSTATSVRVRSGRRTITDGPFAETREVLGGFYLVLAASQAEALAIASRHPGARVGSVEVRPLFDLSSLPISNQPVDSHLARSTA
jgi:hypothetical protein